MADVPAQLIVAAFQDEYGADEALERLKAAKKEKLIGMENAAVIRKDEGGKLHIKETADMGGGKGAAIGGVTGAALGILLGGVGLVLGAAGAVIGGLTAKFHDSGFSDARLKALGDSLEPATSAIVAVIEQKWLNEVGQALAEEGADVMTMNIAADLAQQRKAGNEVVDSAVDAGDVLVVFDGVAGSEEEVAGESVAVTDEGADVAVVADLSGVDGDDLEAAALEASEEIADEDEFYVAVVENDQGVDIAVISDAPEVKDDDLEAAALGPPRHPMSEDEDRSTES